MNYELLSNLYKEEAEKNKIGKNALEQSDGVERISDSKTSVVRQTEQMKKELDKYIVEVDKCIELINNM